MWEKSPTWKNLFENLGTVQFNHRNFGYLTFSVAVLTAIKARKLNLMKHQRIYVYLMLGFVLLQVANGIATLKHNVIPAEANVHQANAVLVLSSALLLTHCARRPNKAYAKYLK